MTSPERPKYNSDTDSEKNHHNEHIANSLQTISSLDELLLGAI